LRFFSFSRSSRLISSGVFRFVVTGTGIGANGSFGLSAECGTVVDVE
jgi:hypothetical protein